MWVDRAPGQFDGPGPHVAIPMRDGGSSEEGREILMGNLTVPDRVRCPRDAAMGGDAGAELLVLAVFSDRCRHPSCADNPHEVRIFALERGWYVGECRRIGFSWMRL